MFYRVPDMQLIAQDKDISCGHASGQMAGADLRRSARVNLYS